MGNGKIKSFRFNNSGTLKPGKLPQIFPDTGLLEFEGDDGDPLGTTYTQGSGASIEILLAGYTPIDKHDVVSVFGTAVLEPGAYTGLYLDPGFYPVLGDKFNIITATQGIFGTMALGANPSYNGLSFELHTVQITDSNNNPIWAIQAEVVPVPGTLAVFAPAALLALRRRRTLEIGGAGFPGRVARLTPAAT
jgi:hypothetical protein